MTPETSGAWRATRRVARIVRLFGHLLIGAVTAHGILPLLDRLDHDRTRIHAVVRWWNRRLVRILNLRLTIEGEVSTRPTLFVANHISWLDIACLRAVLDVTFVAKEEIRRWPIVGGMAARAGTIFLARGSDNGTTLTADRMTWTLTQRRHLLIFPEGTTSDGRGVRHFHARLYQAAVRTHASVQAVALSYPHAHGVHPAAPFVDNDNLARHLWALLAEDRLTVSMAFCAPLPAAGQQRRTLANRTHAQVCEAIGLKERVAARAAVIEETPIGLRMLQSQAPSG
jgi:1-acyl-sn-glycerol-3-phosphate acyltransferase